MQAALLCCYPLFIHLSVQFEEPWLRAPAVFLLAAGILYKRLLNREKGAWSIFVGIVLLTVAITLTSPSKYLFYLPPVALPGLIGAVFIRSLLPGNQPLVTAIGERVRGELGEQMRRYTKNVTVVWAVLLVAMTLWSALLPWLVGDWLWSIMTNFVNYILIGVLFVGEFTWRKLRFRDHVHPSFKDYMSIVFGPNGIARRS